MGQHVTVILGNGSQSHFHGEVMFDNVEKILVITELTTKAHINFNVADFVVAWVVTEMTDEEEHAIIQAYKDEQEADDGNILGI